MIAEQLMAAATTDTAPDVSFDPTRDFLHSNLNSPGSHDADEETRSECVRDEDRRRAARGDSSQLSELRDFHERHLDGGASGTEEIIGQLILSLRNRLRRKFPLADGEMVSDAVNDGFMIYWETPQVYEASLGVPLEYYLFRAAACNLSNLLRSEKRRKCREDSFGKSFSENSVELSSSAGNPLIDDPIQSLTAQEKWDERLKCLKNQLDRKFVELWKNGELRVAAFAKAFGVAHLALKQQTAAVKRAKDRLTKQLQRARAKFGWTV